MKRGGFRKDYAVSNHFERGDIDTYWEYVYH
jgi:hypothetical protein